MTAQLASLAQVFRFAGVGLTCSAFYFLLASFLCNVAELDAVGASFLAYALSAVFGYQAHRRFTFDSAASVRSEALRFAMVTILGIAISIAVPLALYTQAPVLSFSVVLLIVPACSFMMMKFFVFRV